MANEAHVEKLLEGVEAWNEWRDTKQETPDLEGIDISSDEFRKSPLFKQRAGGNWAIDLAWANLQETRLTRANLKEADLAGADFQGAQLGDANLKRAWLFTANLKEATLDRANLQAAHLATASLDGASLMEADLEDAHLGTASLQEADLAYANLKGVDFLGANLKGARLGHANLQAAVLVGANLEGTQLWNAKLYGACLIGANLQGANLHDADLRGAVLIQASLEGANVTGVKFSRSSCQKAFQGIRVATCYGDQEFKRFAQDQDYIEQLRARPRWGPVLFWLWYIFADCGRCFSRWAGWSVGMAATFSFVYYWLGPKHIHAGDLGFSLITMVYYSVVTFTTLGYGDIRPITESAALLVMAEVILGYIMLGGLVSILANELARRS